MMNLSILHISDLHRDPKNPMRNDPLLDSLERDRQRYTIEEFPNVCPPDMIVVSGDLVQGVKVNSQNAEKELAEQYAEALRFLNQITARFIGGDKRRVVIVPGNHDVSAFHFFQSLQGVSIAEDRKKEIVSQLFSPNSSLRWSWSNFELYEIADRETYDMRFFAFSEFYRQFYENERTYSLDPAKQFDTFDYPEFNVTFVAFNSCHNNDIFNKQGSIHPVCIANAATKLRQSLYHDRLLIAVWHHNTEGMPGQLDYMDPDFLQNLIDRGVSLGFHGHQHKPQFIDCRFRHGGDRRITVISAGTLCGSSAPRFGRTYNVVELYLDERKGKLHLREIQNDNLSLPIWGQRSLQPSKTTFIEFTFDPPPKPFVRSPTSTQILVKAQKHYDDGRYKDAAAIYKTLADSNGIARRLLLDCYGKTNDWKAIVEYFDPPQSNTEAIYLMEALWMENKKDRLGGLLNENIVSDSTDPAVIELRQKYETRLAK